MSDESATCVFCQVVSTDLSRWCVGGPAKARAWLCGNCITSARACYAAEMTRLENEERLDDGGVAIAARLEAQVAGQAAACRTLATAIIEHDVQLAMTAEDGDDAARRGPRVLVVGPPGCGKTTLSEAVKSIVPWTFVMPHASDMGCFAVMSGEMEFQVSRLIDLAGKDMPVAERGVVVIDGFDMRATSRSADNDRREAISREVLRLLDGVTLKHTWRNQHIRIDGLLRIVNVTIDASDLGDGREETVRTALKRLGMAPAVLSRFDHVAVMRPLDRDGLRQILVRPDGVIDRARRVATAVGAEITVARQALDAFAAAADGRPDGAWAVGRPILRLLEDVMTSTPRAWLVDKQLADDLIACV